MTSSWRVHLEQRQAHRKQEHLWRRRRSLASAQGARIEVDGCSLINFSSNDYLGLAGDSRSISAACDALHGWGVGAGASHLVCGHQSPHHALEEALADFVGAERALLFSSGYLANIAVPNSLLGKRDLILQDKLNHASLIDGARLSGAVAKRFAHANIEHAGQILQRQSFERCMIASDGIFSMDGDMAPVDKLNVLADETQSLLLIDDAHGFGVVGNNGRGTLEHYQLAPAGNVIMMGTLGKGLGVFGAFVAADSVIVEELIQSSRSYIYTTALPPVVAAATLRALQTLVREGDELRARLTDRIDQFRQGCRELGLSLLPSTTAIQPLRVGLSDRALALSRQLEQAGFFVPAIRPPTVPDNTARLRFAFSAAHTPSQVNQLLESLDTGQIRELLAS